MNNYSPYMFSFFRIILGTYLCIHFVQLYSYAPEIWSNEGLIPEAGLNLTHGIFPNILSYYDSPGFIQAFIVVLGTLSLFFTLGILRPYVSFLLWYGWVALFDRNNLISNPGIPFIGWLLLCCAAIPKGEPLSLFSKVNTDWELPTIIWYGAWIIMALGYTLSGIDKFSSPSWRDGSAMVHLLNNPLARDWGLREFLLSCPNWLLHLFTWGILLLEILFLPLVAIKYTRKWTWLMMIAMHLGILLVVDFADLTCGMLMIHWFTFDPEWFGWSRKLFKRIDVTSTNSR